MRAMAVYGLGLIGTPAAAPPVLRALNDSNDTVRVSALDATDRLENAKILRTSQAIAQTRVAELLSAPNATVRARAATTLAEFSLGARATQAKNALAVAYSHEYDANVRAHIAWAIYRGFAKTVSPRVILAEANDRDEIVRIQAARAIGRRADKSLLPLAKKLESDPSWRVQEQAIESELALNGKPPTDHLKTIARFVHVPAPVADPFANVKALPRTPVKGKTAAPAADKIIAKPALVARTVDEFTGPQHGPHPRMRIATTKGNIYIVLYPEWAPLTVENFMNLANAGYYDGNPWFRIVPDFVVQSGDPSATAPGPGYTTVAEENPIEQNSYVIAMGLDYTSPPNAHAKRDSAGSEFYINISPQYHLNRDFSVFGRMIAGFDVLGRLTESDKITRVERLPDVTL